MTDVIKVRESIVNNVRHVEVVTTDRPVSVVSIGVQGPPGGILVPYTHQQVVADAQWTINHNLGFKPDVYLYDAGGNEFAGQVLHASVNQAIVYLTVPTAGTARCH